MPQKSCINKKSPQVVHQDTSYIAGLFSGIPNADHNQNGETHNQEDFYQQYKKVLGISYEIKRQLNHQSQLKEELIEKIEELEKNMQNNTPLTTAQIQRKESMKKRSRRMADEIQRKHRCSVQFCEKEYGSEGSLIQHIKLKHPELCNSREQ